MKMKWTPVSGSIDQGKRPQGLSPMSRLSALLRKKNESLNDCRKKRWNNHNRLERGNPVRVY